MKFTKKILPSLAIYLILLGMIASIFPTIIDLTTYRVDSQNYTEPTIPSQWSIKSIDTQIITKYWLNVPKDSIKTQVAMLKSLNINYIAVDTPYDRVSDLQNWVDEIHRQNLHVWFRSHWDNWEGDDGKSANMTPQEYLQQTEKFIQHNPQLFKAGDSFTLAIEPEQAGVGLGKRFLNWSQYTDFLLNEISYSNESFKRIGLEGKIYTNWLSTNAWIAQHVYTKDLANKVGLITIDHYAVQSQTIGSLDDPTHYTNSMSSDLDALYQEWHKPILIGEWGYQIYQDTSEDTQAEVVNDVMSMMKQKTYIVGVNYWSHMGNHSRIINDQNGTKLTYRKAALVIQTLFK